MYTCKYFNIGELVSEHVFNERGEKAWQLLDERALIVLDNLRKRYGPTTINSWSWGGDREWSGLRTIEYYKAEGLTEKRTSYSQHFYGRAMDCIFKNVTAEEVRQDILTYCDRPEFKLIGSIELETSWLHFDVRNCNRIMTYTP